MFLGHLKIYVSAQDGSETQAKVRLVPKRFQKTDSMLQCVQERQLFWSLKKNKSSQAILCAISLFIQNAFHLLFYCSKYRYERFPFKWILAIL
jgi:hypothetical protein